MIQRLATLLITLYISISLQAQDKKKPGFTKEEFSGLFLRYFCFLREICFLSSSEFFFGETRFLFVLRL